VSLFNIGFVIFPNLTDRKYETLTVRGVERSLSTGSSGGSRLLIISL
jgi:hypothetical protein